MIVSSKVTTLSDDKMYFHIVDEPYESIALWTNAKQLLAVVGDDQTTWMVQFNDIEKVNVFLEKYKLKILWSNFQQNNN